MTRGLHCIVSFRKWHKDSNRVYPWVSWKQWSCDRFSVRASVSFVPFITLSEKNRPGDKARGRGGGEGKLIIITHLYLVARVWSVPGFHPYCKPGLHSDHVTEWRPCCCQDASITTHVGHHQVTSCAWGRGGGAICQCCTQIRRGGGGGRSWDVCSPSVCLQPYLSLSHGSMTCTSSLCVQLVSSTCLHTPTTNRQ